jgi:hypothetical protein
LRRAKDFAVADLTPGRLILQVISISLLCVEAFGFYHSSPKFGTVTRLFFDEVVEFSHLYASFPVQLKVERRVGRLQQRNDNSLARRLGQEHLSPQSSTRQETEVDRRMHGRTSVHLTADAGDPRVEFADDSAVFDLNRVFEIENVVIVDVYSADLPRSEKQALLNHRIGR